MELNSSDKSGLPQSFPSQQKQFLTSNMNINDVYLFSSQKNIDADIKCSSNQIEKDNFPTRPSYFTIDEKNSSFTKEINPSFKCNILICRGCQLLLGYKTFIQKKEKHFMILSGLLNYKIDPEAEDDHFLYVFCMSCNEQLGIKINNNFFIYNAMICEKNRIMTAAIISLKKDLNDEFEKLLNIINQQLNLQITIHHFHLQKSQLQNFKLQFNYDICIIIHKEEGRLLLFDENGIYNHVYRECFKNTKGNVLFILLLNDYFHQQSSQKYFSQSKTHENSSQDCGSSKVINNENKSQLNGDIFSIQNPIYDKNLIKDISENGKQPLLQLLSKNQLVMTIIEQINILQINFLMNFVHNSQYKPLVPSELNYNLGFTKIYLKINIEKSQNAVLSYFIQESQTKSEFNIVIQQLQQQSLKVQKIKDSQDSDTNLENQVNDVTYEKEKNQKCSIF
ncbi:hypothetical protein TTHERM_000632871 (macronuclear) [Tetrahymena thermophila SB210]|uniref:Uncharacterized protein n=1 Tax=Tetrahymena thermophila (strain SB210) TaxID=312017 RepID=W7XJS2_TETTS|nr:hypothetical protein TTHERM_000632871 [Tetrahymena thermophila SB210]EWS75891.1 hypothetical protein TTHERM_000632871 [Tetrahymena thermophila SB210]|eukprot:XP_012651562.1 hypothetical protein TTHERM_000632871 [Tetrahymena thermophila SB210]